MTKGTKKNVGSKAGRKGAVAAEIQNDEVMAEPLTLKEENAQEAKVEQGDEEDEVSESEKKIAARRGGKRKRAKNKETDEKKQAPSAKKSRATKPSHEEPDYFEEKRNLEDLWKAAFPVGTEWEALDALYVCNWDFKHLEEALEEGGMLYGKKVFIFVNTEAPTVSKAVLVPTVIAIESPFPPSDKIAITSVQSGSDSEIIIPMKQMKMEWVPYIPFEKRDRQVDWMKFEIFILGCTQRRSALRHLKEERVMKFQYCLPYFYDPFKEDELENSTDVDIVFPSEPPVVCEFDWKFDKLEVFVDNEGEELSAEQKDEFKEYVKEHVLAAKKARQEARVARLKAIEELSEDAKQAIGNMKFYKFYPQNSSSMMKTPYINRYYGYAHQVF